MRTMGPAIKGRSMRGSGIMGPDNDQLREMIRKLPDGAHGFYFDHLLDRTWVLEDKVAELQKKIAAIEKKLPK